MSELMTPEQLREDEERSMGRPATLLDEAVLEAEGEPIVTVAVVGMAPLDTGHGVLHERRVVLGSINRSAPASSLIVDTRWVQTSGEDS